MALWDLAGKITGLRVVELLGGPFRDAITMYSHGSAGLNMLDPSSCREWAKQIRSAGEGFRAFKINVDRAAGVPSGRYTMATLTTEQVRNVGRAFANVREAVGEEIDIAVHCHNEFDAPSALAVAKAVEPMNPLFLEDPLPVPFSESWMSLKRSTRIPILTGEKLEMVAGFRPFLDHQGADIIHPDLAFAGGITGTKKIADYAMLTRTPVALHNVGSLVLTFASAHFGAAIQNFFRSESALGRPTRHVENMAASNPPEVRNGMLKVPEGPGLGLALNEEYLKSQLVDGEKFWS
jgi:galactonate dehydratase